MSAEESGPTEASPRWTLVGFAAGGLLFVALGLYLNLATGFAATDNPGPVAILALIGATVGGLVAPLLSSLVEGRRGGDDAAG